MLSKILRINQASVAIIKIIYVFAPGTKTDPAFQVAGPRTCNSLLQLSGKPKLFMLSKNILKLFAVIPGIIYCAGSEASQKWVAY